MKAIIEFCNCEYGSRMIKIEIATSKFMKIDNKIFDKTKVGGGGRRLSGE